MATQMVSVKLDQERLKKLDDIAKRLNTGRTGAIKALLDHFTEEELVERVIEQLRKGA